MNKMLALMDGYKLRLVFEQVFHQQMHDDIHFLVDGDFTDPLQLVERADMQFKAKQLSEADINTMAPSPRKATRPTTAYTDETSTTSPGKATNKYS